MEEETAVDRQTTRSGWLLVAGAIVGATLTVGAVLLAIAVLVPDQAEALEAPRFVEEAQAAGVAHVYDGDFSFFVGGGVAVLDCDADGLQDLYFAGGSNPASLYRNQSAIGGELRFVPAGHASTHLTDVVGAYPLDIDSDDNLDLMVLRLGENVALRGMGDCRFERANETWGIDGGNEWTAGFSATWEPGNRLPTLAFGNYLDWPIDRELGTTCADNVLLRPDGDSYGTPTALSPGWCTLSVLFTDWDQSGRYDLRVANDRHYYISGTEQLWRISPGAAPELYGAQEGWNDLKIWGMGIASRDVTGDGLPEFFVTSQGDNKLQTLALGPTAPTYDDIAIAHGVTAHRPHVGDNTLPSTAWHPEFQDVNNDGFVDLFITKGNVEATPEYTMLDPNNLLLGQPDGTFLEGGSEAGVASTARSRGAAVVDFNLDGLLDIVVVNRTVNVELYRNVGSGTSGAPESMGNWLAIRVEQSGTNVDVIGATITVEAGDAVTTIEIAVGGGHAGDQVGWVHFGLGDREAADVRVEWSDGTMSEYEDVAADRFVVLESGQPLKYWSIAAP